MTLGSVRGCKTKATSMNACVRNLLYFLERQEAAVYHNVFVRVITEVEGRTGWGRSLD